MGAPKPWGWWTQHKLLILERYLQAFATASKGVSERIYLDLFAGWPENVSRETGETVLGSVHRALGTHPPFTRVALFELPGKADQLRAALEQRYPGQERIRVYAGDCNETLTQAARDLDRLRWAPTFAFVDQFDNEVQWETLRRLSLFRRDKKRGLKAELWILVAPSFNKRGLGVRQVLMNASYGESLDAMFGTDEWRHFVEGQRAGLLTPSEVDDEFTNLMRWRLVHELGYAKSHAFTMKNTGGRAMYDMVFVSDHEAGDRIMGSIYGKALREHEQMRQDALALRSAQRKDQSRSSVGEAPLFDLDPELVVANEVDLDQVYEPLAPRKPFRMPSRH